MEKKGPEGADAAKHYAVQYGAQLTCFTIQLKLALHSKLSIDQSL